jgi:hypothetical protein
VTQAHEQTISFAQLRSWKSRDGGVDVDYVMETGETRDAFFVLPQDQILEVLVLLDGYFALYPESLKTNEHKANNPWINMLGTSDMYEAPRKRVFTGRYGSRLEYLKSDYLEICLNDRSNNNVAPLREFCW